MAIKKTPKAKTFGVSYFLQNELSFHKLQRIEGNAGAVVGLAGAVVEKDALILPAALEIINAQADPLV